VKEILLNAVHSILLKDEISGSHGGEDVDHDLLICDTVSLQVVTNILEKHAATIFRAK
jgi:hypothetical protein